MILFSNLHMLTTWHCPHSPATCCCCSSQYLLSQHRPTSANLQQWVCCCGPMLGHRRTDIRTNTVPFHRPRSGYMWAVPTRGAHAFFFVVSRVVISTCQWELQLYKQLQLNKNYKGENHDAQEKWIVEQKETHVELFKISPVYG